MPNVRMPDGQVVSVPEGTTKAELARRYGLHQEKSKPSLGARVGDMFTGNLRETRATEELPELVRSAVFAGEDVPLWFPSVMQTATNTRELADIITRTFPNIGISQDEKGNLIAGNNATGQQAVINKPGWTLNDTVQAIMLGAAFTPAGRAGMIPKGLLRRGAAAGAAAAVTEAGLQSAQKAAGGEFDAPDVAMAGGMGTVGQTVGDVAGMGYRALRGTPGGLPDQQVIAQQAQQRGVPLTTTDVLPPKTQEGRQAQQLVEKIPIIGTGQGRAAQQVAREKAVDEFAEGYAEYSPKEIVDDLKAQSARRKRGAGNVLQTTGDALDAFGEVGLTKTQAAIQSARSVFTKPGTRKYDKGIALLDEIEETMAEAPQSFSMLKEHRTHLRGDLDSVDAAGRSQLQSREKALLKQVETAMKADMDAAARSNLSPEQYAKWNRANAEYAKHADTMKNTRIKGVLDKGDLTPEKAMELVMSKKPSEVNLMYNSLGPTGRKHVRAALISSVVDTLSKRASGISPNTFNSELKKRGLQTGVFFKGEEKAQLDGLMKLLDATRRAQDAGVMTPTGQQLFLPVMGGVALADPTIAIGGGIALSVLGNIYESPPVRNALLRLNSLPPGSPGFLKALDEASAIIQTATQVARSENVGDEQPAAN